MPLATWFICALAGRDLRFSIFYRHPTDEALLAAEETRRVEAEAWARDAPPLPLERNQAAPRLCVCFLTTLRDDRPSKYVGNAVKSLLEDLTVSDAAGLYLAAVVRGPDPFPAILGQFHAVAHTDPQGRGSSFAITDELTDYVTALRLCNASRASLVLVLQDDTVATRGALQLVLARAAAAQRVTKGRWVLLKLFYHEFWEGWSVDSTPNLVIFCVCFFAALAVTLWLILRLRMSRSSVEPLLLALLVASSCTFCVAWGCYALGRQHALPVFHAGLNPNHGSAAVALLYNNAHSAVSSLIVRLEQLAAGGAAGPVDLCVDQWAEESGQGAFISWPPLFQHVGLTSSLAHNRAEVGRRKLMYKQSLAWRPDYRWSSSCIW
jgi:hypothetical protein